MKSIQLYIVLLFLAPLSLVQGQISPGDLSQAHADLEGMSNCTLCHDLGNKVSNTKCLDCHEVIQGLMDNNRGYHANREVRTQDCFDCHSEHHGRKFDMVRFDEDNFDHDLTGYELEGKHKVIDCRQCHVPDNMTDSRFSERENTFLGLGKECLSCHYDYHQQTLSTDCAKCHDFKAFEPAAKFNHDRADYPLVGKHKDVDCIECHEKGFRNGREFQFFTDVDFSDCIACHDDPHNSQLEGQCAQCHVETSFSSFIGQREFDHTASTDFRLKGKHRPLDCYSCHKESQDPRFVFQDRLGVRENQCATCHEDVHQGKFGNDCAQCHQEESFLSLKSMDFFNHDLTDYPLEGKHIGIDCKNCHVDRFLDPINFMACNNCHDDYHNGEFERNFVSPDCVECHSLEEGFDYSLYTLEQHQQTAFPLEGAHIATPCFVCHVSEDSWTFRDIGVNCIDCHEDIHEGLINENYYPDKQCEACHNSDSWASVSFDHKLTDWPLEAGHQTVSCSECHFSTSVSDTDVGRNQTFNGLNNECISCHENIHGDQFAINGVTECTRCHDADSWFPNQFDHSATAFPLDGAHAEVDCRACHIPSLQDGKIVTHFKIEKFDCIDCHE